MTDMLRTRRVRSSSGRRSSKPRLAASCSAALFVFGVGYLLPARAHGYEDQLTLGVQTGFAQATLAEDWPDSGGYVGMTTSLGLDDIWTLRAQVGYGQHPGGEQSLRLALGGLELLYLIDVLELVPFFGVGGSVLAAHYDGDTSMDPAVHGVVGIDYLVSERFVVGIDLRPYLLLASLDTRPIYWSVLLRFETAIEL